MSANNVRSVFSLFGHFVSIHPCLASWWLCTYCLSNWKLVLSRQLLMAGWAQKHGPINNCYGYTWTRLPVMKHFSGFTLKTQIFVRLCHHYVGSWELQPTLETGPWLKHLSDIFCKVHQFKYSTNSGVKVSLAYWAHPPYITNALQMFDD